MTRTPLLLAIVVTAALAGCSNEDQNNVAGTGDGNTTNVAVELPPSIAASKTYRCSDNTITYVDWMTDNSPRTSVLARAGGDDGDCPRAGPADDQGEWLFPDRHGSGSSISLTTPEHGKQSCKA